MLKETQIECVSNEQGHNNVFFSCLHETHFQVTVEDLQNQFETELKYVERSIHHKSNKNQCLPNNYSDDKSI